MVFQEAPEDFLAELAPHAAPGWIALGTHVFVGGVDVETRNSVYRFRDGVFTSRATKPARALESPKTMQGLRLIGFLTDDRGLWALTPRWERHAHAVMWRADRAGAQSFILTSETHAFSVEAAHGKRDGDARSWSQRVTQSQSGVRGRARPPRIVRPQPPSMTRIHLGVPVTGDR